MLISTGLILRLGSAACKAFKPASVTPGELM